MFVGRCHAANPYALRSFATDFPGLTGAAPRWLLLTAQLFEKPLEVEAE
jgi:hypothetical protein